MKTIIRIGVVTLVIALLTVLHYTLPRYDVVRVVGVDVQRLSTEDSIFFADSERTASDGARDVRMIQAIKANGDATVYRNEDTGWGWPPYFKFDSANVQARASDLISDTEEPVWALVTRYGWRNTLLSIYPNAVSLEEIASPEDKPFPWINVVIVLGLIVLGVALNLFAGRFIRLRRLSKNESEVQV